MQLQVLASSSKGNAYVLHSDTGSLLIEAGIPFHKIKEGLEYNISNVIGCLISHEHSDHSKAAKEVMSSGIDTYMSKGTAEALSLTGHRLHIIESPYNEFSIQDFTIRAIVTEHDAAEPIGFLIYYRPTDEKILFATDTYFIRYSFKALNYIMVECNYIPELLDWNVAQGRVDITHRNRLIKSHFSLPHVIEFLRANNMETVKKIVLLHLSDDNSDSNKMLAEIREITRRHTCLAEPGITIAFDKAPF